MRKLLLLMLLLPTLVFATTKLKVIKLTKKNTISFNKPFSIDYISLKQVEAISVCGANVGSDIYIVLNTPGGSISAGLLLFDTLKALPCKFHTITLFSASMGYQTVQALGKRYILPSGVLMSHRARISGLSGEFGGELTSIMKHLYDTITEMEMISSKRVGLSLKQYRSEISDELWLTGSEAVKKNHADEVVVVRCMKSLLGYHKEVFRTIFGDVRLKMSNCPVITSPLLINADNVRSAVEFMKQRKIKLKKHKTTI